MEASRAKAYEAIHKSQLAMLEGELVEEKEQKDRLRGEQISYQGGMYVQVQCVRREG
jgi:hypothetical protein